MGYDRYCDHNWMRDDAHCKVCLKCHRRKEVER